MKSFQDQWREYRDRVYPEGLSAIQNRECHQAFFAGALVALYNCMALADLKDDMAEKKLCSILGEVEAVCKARAQTLQDRN